MNHPLTFLSVQSLIKNDLGDSLKNKLEKVSNLTQDQIHFAYKSHGVSFLKQLYLLLYLYS